MVLFPQQKCGVRKDVKSLSLSPHLINQNVSESELLEIVRFNELFVRITEY